MIGIINCGGANLQSVMYALDRINLKYKVSDTWNDLKNSRALILPGVGAAGTVMRNLKNLNLIENIKNDTRPILGICVGMQIFFDFSEEENKKCMEIIPGKIKKFSNRQLTIPHMGWNKVKFSDPYFEDCNGYFYFANSYYAGISEHTLGFSHYGIKFSSFINKKNFYGVQFHPEKSSNIGKKFLTKFFDMI